jgi:mevalonate kinase
MPDDFTMSDNLATQTLHANGKLLLTAEYFVLDGAQALCMPLRSGQSLIIKQTNQPGLGWKSTDHQGKTWFEGRFDDGFNTVATTDQTVSDRLTQILQAAQRLSNSPCEPLALEIETILTFDRLYGWGTSSTLISLVARWADVDPYALLEATFGGSGYDLACAETSLPLIYQRGDKKPTVEPVSWIPPALDKWHLVWLGAKQDSRLGISRYRALKHKPESAINTVNQLTQKLLEAQSLSACMALFAEHEQLVADLLGLIPVQKALFSDFDGQVKSLGAWGGDFVLVLSKLPRDEVKTYFDQRGFSTCLAAQDVFLC